MSALHHTNVPQTHPPGDGWRDWLWSMYDADGGPYRHRVVEVWRKSWQEVEVMRLSSMPPWMNVAGLWWRPLQKPVLEPEVVK